MTRAEVKELLSKEERPVIKQKLQLMLDNMDFFEKEEKPLINDLKTIGITVESVWDLVNNRPIPLLNNVLVGDYENAYPILIKHLDIDYHPRVKEGIIRALTEKKASKIASAKILKLFYSESNKNLKWAMANALKTLMTWKQRQKHPEIDSVWKGQ